MSIQSGWEYTTREAGPGVMDENASLPTGLRLFKDFSNPPDAQSDFTVLKIIYSRLASQL
ncbi:MAG: hypothetical protein MI807_13680 [Verrucomicrobiales bacterium]|nr:hypothetical protein [Verrucomicrobiales bacterium]